MQDPTSGPSQRATEAGGSLTLETQGRAGAASTTPGRPSTARWVGLGKQDGEVYECRNQWWNPLKKLDRLQPGGWPVLRCAACLYNRGGRSWCLRAPGATVKACGVAVARPAGEKLGTYPVDRLAVNVGTAL